MVEFFDAEYEIEKRIVRGFRAIFEKDSRFVYNKNQKESDLMITIDYPDDAEVVEKIPHMVVTGINISNNTQNTFGYNFYKDVTHKGIVNGAQEYAYILPYSLTILCSGQQSISKDLASRVQWYISFGAAEQLSENLGLQINDVRKGQCSPSKQFPQKIFDTPIQISGTLYWIGTKCPENSLASIDKPLKNVNIKF